MNHEVPPQDISLTIRQEYEDPFLKSARQIVDNHLNDSHFSVKEFCQELGISHSQLHRKLAELAGQSASTFIRNIRLHAACEMLADPQLTVTAVAYDTGFRDADYFYRVFKKTFGVTPGEFRKAKNLQVEH